jgi:hypothetical protein
MRFLRPFECFLGMFQGLFGMLVSRQVILFPVMHRRGTMRVCRQLMKFRSSLVGIVWHSGPPLRCYLYFRTIPFFKLSNSEHFCTFAEFSLGAPFHGRFIPFPGDEGPTGRSAKRQYRCT